MADRHRRRAGASRIAGRRRADYLAHRIGGAFRECRHSLRLTQTEAADRAGVSQGFWSALESGEGTYATLETLASCAAAVGVQLASFIEAVPGSDLPRDIEHLRRQNLIIATARVGGWRAMPERPIDRDARRSRSIDVLLERPARGEIAVVEVVDWLADAGEVIRGLGDKVAAIRRETNARVGGLLVLRATARNRATVRSLGTIFASRFSAASAGWLSALAVPTRPMPDSDGLAWSTSRGDRLFAVRLGRS
jgi:transcriptional regulator with XRE-family HTH domain